MSYHKLAGLVSAELSLLVGLGPASWYEHIPSPEGFLLGLGFSGPFLTVPQKLGDGECSQTPTEASGLGAERSSGPPEVPCGQGELGPGSRCETWDRKQHINMGHGTSYQEG